MLRNTIQRVCWDIETDGMQPEAIVQLYGEDDPSLMDERQLKKLEKRLVAPALDPMTGVICALGFKEQGEDDAPVRFLLGKESDILIEFWWLWEHWCNQGATLLTWNGHGFDLPYVLRRSHALNIPVKAHLVFTSKSRRFYKDYCIDLMLAFSAGSQKFCSLGDVGRFLGFGGKSNGCSGASFAETLRSNKAAALQYLRTDVELTSLIAERLLGPIRPLHLDQPKFDDHKSFNYRRASYR